MTRGIALRISLVTLALAVGAGALAFFVAPMVLGDTQAPAVSAETTAGPTQGIIHQLPLRVLNLSPGGRFSYLKIDIALELDPPALAGDDSRAEESAWGAEIEEGMAAVEDGINTAITSRSSDSLISAEGKAALKDEIRRLASEALGHSVRNVYFTQFVMQ